MSIPHRTASPFRLALATLVVAAAACTPPPDPASGPRPAAGPPTQLGAAEWTADSPPREIAAWAREGCRRPREGKQACLEAALLSLLQPAGIAKALEVLDHLVAADADVQRDAHVYAHGIGIAAYRDAATVSRTFAACTPAHQSGCYHGVIQAYFADPAVASAGVDSLALNGLCAELRGPEDDWLQHQCGHGMGHGLMAVHGHHLLRALDDCDRLADVEEESACWGGALMENIVNALTPHHTATTNLAGGGGHGNSGHHDHGGGAHAEEAFKALDDDDPLYPCTIVKEHHRPACYLMQTSPVLHRSHGDFAEASRVCMLVEDSLHRDFCFTSLGRDAVAWSNEDFQRGLRMCGEAPEAYEPSCIVGYTKNLVDRTADPESGFVFCRVVPDGPGRTACYRAVGEEIAVLDPSTAGRVRRCAPAGEEWAVVCRRGAGVEPSGLPE